MSFKDESQGIAISDLAARSRPPSPPSEHNRSLEHANCQTSPMEKGKVQVTSPRILKVNQELRRSARLKCSNGPMSTEERIARAGLAKDLERTSSLPVKILESDLKETTALGSIYLQNESKIQQDITMLATTSGFIFRAGYTKTLSEIGERACAELQD